LLPQTGGPAKPGKDRPDQVIFGLALVWSFRCRELVENSAKISGQGVNAAQAGHHHHIAGPYLLRYAQEASWREDHRRISNGDHVHAVSGLAMKRGPSVDFCGYWQLTVTPMG
jgi:hypothetical protein